MLLSLLVIAVAAWLLPCSVAAQQLAAVSYSSDDGPAHAQVWCAFQDSRGYMWLGTSEGLSRWDGVEFLSFTTADGLQNLTVRTIQEDAEGNLWLGTDEGVARFDGRIFETFVGAEGPGDGTVWCSALDHHGRVWFGTQLGGVGVWTGSQFASFTAADGLASDSVYGLLADSSGHLWLGHRGAGLTRCNIATDARLFECRTFTTADGLTHNEVRSVAEDLRGMVWIGTRGGGVCRWDGDRFKSFTHSDDPKSNDVYAMLVDSRDQLVVGTSRVGITMCDLPKMSSCRSYGMHNGLADDSIFGLTLDNDQSLWVTAANGVSQLFTEDLETYTLTEGLPHHTVYSLLPDRDGLLAGTMDGLVRIRRSLPGTEPPRIETWQRDGILPGHEVWEVRRDSLGRLWVATEKGLCRFDQGRCVQVLTAEDGLADTDLITLVSTSDGSLWVGTINGASRLRFFAGKETPEVLNLTEADGLLGSLVYGLGEDSAGTIWLGTAQGLSRWDGESMATFSVDDGLPVREIQRIVTDTTGRLWVGTNGGGLVEIREHQDGTVGFEIHGPAERIPEVVSAIFDAGSGVLWLGTGNGALLYDPDAADPQDAVLDRIDSASGLAGNEVNAFATDQSGALWIATSGGLTRVDPRRKRRSLPAPRVSIERVWTAAGQRWRAPFTAPSALQQPDVHWIGDTAPRLAHDFAALRFEYRALAFRPRKSAFQVWLEGFDHDWSTPSTATFKEYTNLDPGSYTFHVRAASAYGAPGEAASLPFVVVPAWWQTGWARLSLLLSLLFLVVTGVRFRTSQIRRRAEELERAVAERTDDLRRYARALEEHSRALDRANLKIREADRVKSEFLANISHELRTPLNSIIGFSELLCGRLDGRVESRELSFLSNVSRSGRYLLLLINNLLDLTKIEADRMEVHIERVALVEVLEDTLRVFQGYARDREVEVNLLLDQEPIEVETDVAKLNQVLINLLSNAVKFSSPGTSVEVRVTPVAAADSALGVPSFELAVEDHGPGIRSEDGAVIFEAFRQAGSGQTHPGGTGLGLALVKRFVTLLGGRVSFDSVPGEGTVFRVLLPVQHGQTPAAPLEHQTARDPAEPITRPCVLVVEPDRRQFSTVAHALESRGLLPVRAGDATEVQRMADGLRPAALVIRWAGGSDRDWATLVALTTPPRSMPTVLAPAAHRIVSEPLAADLCLELPVAAADLITMMSGLGVESAASIILAGGEAQAAKTLRTTLEEAGYKAMVIEDAARSSTAQPDLVILDLSGNDPSPLFAARRLAPRWAPRILLLPSHPPRLTVPEGVEIAPATELAHEIRDLLARRAGMLPGGR